MVTFCLFSHSPSLVCSSFSLDGKKEFIQTDAHSTLTTVRRRHFTALFLSHACIWSRVSNFICLSQVDWSFCFKSHITSHITLSHHEVHTSILGDDLIMLTCTNLKKHVVFLLPSVAPAPLFSSFLKRLKRESVSDKNDNISFKSNRFLF